LAKPHLLFLCVANSARSQMAEALARHAFGEGAVVASAGSQPKGVHPLALNVLQEAGVSTEGLTSKHVDTIDPEGVDYVFTLCAEEACPLFLGEAERVSWAMPDPDPKGRPVTEEEALAGFRTARDAIARRIEALGHELGLGASGSR